jgi:Pentapeptide repeats (8 copies)
MTQQENLRKIAVYLTRFSEQIRLMNAAQDFSINILSENVLVTLLNKVYDCSFVNMNMVKDNHPVIDLLDEKARIGVQVTATADISKIYQVIEGYYRHKLYNSVDRIIFYILTRKREIKQSSIDEKINQVRTAIGSALPVLLFDVKKDILDNESLFKQLSNSGNTEKIEEIAWYLKKQFAINSDDQADLKGYYARLGNMFFDIVMNDERGMTLDQSYVEPSFLLHGNAFKKNGKRLYAEKFLKIDPRYKLVEFIDDFLYGTNPLKCNDTSNVLLLLGYPGQGKSSLLKRYLFEYISQKRQEKKLCYFISLRNIRNIREFIADPMTVLYNEVCMEVGYKLDPYFFKQSVLFLDGLDELYMKDNLLVDEIDRLVHEVVVSSGGAKIIMTSRYGYVDDEKLVNDRILIVQLSLFTLADQRQWLGKYRRFYPDTWLTDEKLQAIHDDLEFNYLKELIQQPLLLYMVASLPGEVNSKINRAQIYDRLFTELIDRKYNKSGPLEIFRHVTKQNLRKLIREVAFVIHKSGVEYVSKSQLLSENATKEFLTSIPDTSLRDSIKGIMIAFYFRDVRKDIAEEFMEDQDSYAIEFLHKSLREYMTAEKIVLTIRSKFLEKIKPTGKYRIAILEEAISTLQSLFAYGISIDIKGYIREIITEYPVEIKQELEDRLMFLFPELLEANFIRGYDHSERISPISLGLNVFEGFWHFVSCLGFSKNYITSEMKLNLISLLRLLTSEGNRVNGFSFDYQQFSDFEFKGINFTRCSFKDSTFKGCSIVDSSFEECWFEGTKFQSDVFFDIDMRRCKYNDCDFMQIKFKSSRFIDADIMRCSFNFIDSLTEDFFIFGEMGNIKIENSFLKNSSIHPTAYQFLQKHSRDLLFEKVNEQEKDEVFNLSSGVIYQENKTDVGQLPEDYKRVII